MDILIKPKQLSGTVKMPDSKSDLHRKLICAALSDKKTIIKCDIASLNNDIIATISGLKALGADITESNNCIEVRPLPFQSSPTINCQESGSMLRFLLPVVAAVSKKSTFEGSPMLSERPLEPLLKQMEVNGSKCNSYKLPVTLSGKLESGKYILLGDISSQFISGLLFALPLLNGNSIIELTTSLESAPYIEMTIETLSQFGITIEKNNLKSFKIAGGQKYKSPGLIETEGDWSASAFFLAAGALGNSEQPIICTGLSKKTFQGDKAIVEILKDFGAKIKWEGNSLQIERGNLLPIEIDASQIPDLVPALAIIACGVQGKTIIKNTARLKAKECDRVSATIEIINSLGGCAEEGDNSIIITGKKNLNGGIISDYNDHRIVMAAATASVLCSEYVTIYGAHAAKKSYPAFFRDFNSIGGKAYVI